MSVHFIAKRSRAHPHSRLHLIHKEKKSGDPAKIFVAWKKKHETLSMALKESKVSYHIHRPLSGIKFDHQDTQDPKPIEKLPSLIESIEKAKVGVLETFETPDIHPGLRESRKVLSLWYSGIACRMSFIRTPQYTPSSKRKVMKNPDLCLLSAHLLVNCSRTARGNKSKKVLWTRPSNPRPGSCQSGKTVAQLFQVKPLLEFAECRAIGPSTFRNSISCVQSGFPFS